ncbi:MAG: FtsQ-type POTRA domain-containing protein [Hydrogenophaga sp.]|uniref:cell division protein FtsQ/DivIB n=1 Tax=Hydrogenophaga sp. TaxID=1904254 RepID=UPI00169EC9E4|nr:cell division protein FtsQ/DivIB [Hydrogenophaga sp.]NIM43074.1 FtsQ-type POTRA domain-containing protein [Hydrogenophaga sp.]NIN28142.1 FtsQ-type POTRA domain-containing protein [Hydrogenophaga sp.]NIN30580.1 FtsQ-type POTRA domain-containing protein [Hydrogenophaga sp.]NIN57277.1 FtsQ-type POTRA domain-containing protein [Hydrogenophaga sp.]NIO51496.1 FtsQ-type POTRA domain-containing protein [Hydrogenophaga sp.]
MPPTTDMPLDVKLMALATQLLLGVFALLALGALGTWAVRHPAWTVKGISVHGDVAHQNAVGLRAQLATQMRARLSSSFLTVDLEQVRQMFEQVPWVRRAVVQREFPNRLRVTLQEHDAVAWWGEQGSGELVNSHGEVFEASPDDVDGLPELAGPDGRAAEVLALHQALQAQFARLELGLDRLQLGERGGWRARLHSGAVIELGRGTPEELQARVQRFVGTLPQITERYAGALQTVDLRYPNGYALRVRGVTTTNDQATPNTPSNR